MGRFRKGRKKAVEKHREAVEIDISDEEKELPPARKFKKVRFESVDREIEVGLSEYDDSDVESNVTGFSKTSASTGYSRVSSVGLFQRSTLESRDRFSKGFTTAKEAFRKRKEKRRKKKEERTRKLDMIRPEKAPTENSFAFWSARRTSEVSDVSEVDEAERKRKLFKKAFASINQKYGAKKSKPSATPAEGSVDTTTLTDRIPDFLKNLNVLPFAQNSEASNNESSTEERKKSYELPGFIKKINLTFAQSETEDEVVLDNDNNDDKKQNDTSKKKTSLRAMFKRRRSKRRRASKQKLNKTTKEPAAEPVEEVNDKPLGFVSKLFRRNTVEEVNDKPVSDATSERDTETIPMLIGALGAGIWDWFNTVPENDIDEKNDEVKYDNRSLKDEQPIASKSMTRDSSMQSKSLPSSNDNKKVIRKYKPRRRDNLNKPAVSKMEPKMEPKSSSLTKSTSVDEKITKPGPPSLVKPDTPSEVKPESFIPSVDDTKQKSPTDEIEKQDILKPIAMKKKVKEKQDSVKPIAEKKANPASLNVTSSVPDKQSGRSAPPYATGSKQVPDNVSLFTSDDRKPKSKMNRGDTHTVRSSTRMTEGSVRALRSRFSVKRGEKKPQVEESQSIGITSFISSLFFGEEKENQPNSKPQPRGLRSRFSVKRNGLKNISNKVNKEKDSNKEATGSWFSFGPTTQNSENSNAVQTRAATLGKTLPKETASPIRKTKPVQNNSLVQNRAATLGKTLPKETVRKTKAVQNNSLVQNRATALGKTLPKETVSAVKKTKPAQINMSKATHANTLNKTLPRGGNAPTVANKRNTFPQPKPALSRATSSPPLVTVGTKTSTSNIAKMWNAKLEERNATQASNPFSSSFKGTAKVNKDDPNYGKPLEGSKSHQRMLDAQKWVDKEIDRLLAVMREHGSKTHQGHEVTFGVLFKCYENISDSLVGILMRARKRNLIHFDHEGLLFFPKHEDVVMIAFH